MGKYKEVREVIVNSLSDKQWHGVDEIQSKCEEEGINLEGNRGPIYNVVHQLKKASVKPVRLHKSCMCISLEIV